MKKTKVRETLLYSHDLSDLNFDIKNAQGHFMSLLNAGALPEHPYFDDYLELELMVDVGFYTIEGVRWETDEEFEIRKTIMEDKEYKKFLELKEKFGHIDK